MPPELIRCPECGVKLRLQGQAPGTEVRCPKCSHQFEVPETASDPANLPPRPADPEESYTDAPSPRPRSRRARSEEEFMESPGEAPAWEEEGWREGDDEEIYDRGGGRGLRDLSADYTIDVNQWFGIATAHYSAVLGPMIGYALIYFLISFVLGMIPFIGGIIQLFLDPPLQTGFLIVALAQLKGKRWSFGDFFSGFQWYGALLANQLLLVLLMLPFIGPGIVLLVIAAQVENEGLLVVSMVAILVGLLPAVYLGLRLGIFSKPLIVDRGCGPIEAMGGSWTLTQGHFWGLLGVALLLGLIYLGGALLCGIGLLFAIPLATLVLAAGYLLIAGTRPPLEKPRT